MPAVSVELNFYYMHYNDAATFASWAEERAQESVNPSIYARHSILSVVFASEALINRVLSELGSGPELPAYVEKCGIVEKWLLAPYLCSAGGKVTSFDRGAEPVQSFKELVQIRNWLAHPKVDTFLPGSVDPKSSISVMETAEEYPWLEMLRGDAWKQTRIPKNPFELTHEHAKAAIATLDKMVLGLNERIGGALDKQWLDRITIRDERGLHNYRAPVSSIWGGYGGGAA